MIIACDNFSSIEFLVVESDLHQWYFKKIVEIVFMQKACTVTALVRYPETPGYIPSLNPVEEKILQLSFLQISFNVCRKILEKCASISN